MFYEDLFYNGTTLLWHHHGSFKATSGLEGHQNASEQTHVDEGPIPEGMYSLVLALAKDATMVGEGVLDVREGIEHLPGTFHFHGKDFTNVAWGPDRVRLRNIHIENPKARHRGGFYLHDSVKGYSHGCIEVDPSFFTKLREFTKQEAPKRGGRRHLYLKVTYPSKTASTYGGTKVP